MATSLTRLQLASNPLALSLNDVSGILARLPQLEALTLGGSATASDAAWARLSEVGVEVAVEAESDDDEEEEEEGGE